jgi:hypothetical protein
VEQKLNKLEDESEQRRGALQRIDPDAIRAADWVRRNQHKLQRKVWGPVVLEMQVNDSLHAKYVEDTLSKWLMGALVTECKEDYDVIINELKSDNVRIKASVVNVQDGRCTDVNRPYSSDQVASFREQFGISGYLDEVRRSSTPGHERSLDAWIAYSLVACVPAFSWSLRQM